MAKNSKEAKPFGLFGTTMIGLGSIISSGIFIIGGLAIDRATSSILVSLAIAAFLAVLSGICFTQLESFFAKDGGVFEYTREALSPRLGFLAGSLWVFSLLSLAAGVADRIANSTGILLNVTLPVLYSASISIVAIILATLFITSRFKVSVKLLILFIAINVFAISVTFGFGTGYIRAADYSFAITSSDFTNILLSASVIFLGFSGFARLPAVRNETAGRDKTIKRATFLTITLLFLAYAALCIITIAVIARTNITNVGPLLEETYLIGTPFLPQAYSILRIIALFGLVLVSLVGGVKTLYSMTKLSELPKSLNAENSNGKPVNLVVYAAFTSIVLLFIIPSNTLLYVAAACMLLSFLLVNLGVINIVTKNANDPRVKNSFMGNNYFLLIPVIAVIGIILLIINVDQYSLLIALIVIVLSLLYHQLDKIQLRKRKRFVPHVAHTGMGEFSR